MDFGYRFKQFRELIHAQPLPENAWKQIEDALSPAELALFERFSLADQRHSYLVLQTLCQAGYDHPDLLAAALLHDIGKADLHLNTVERVIGALGDIFAPRLVAQWGQGAARGWRRPFVIRVQHPSWGADMAETAGSRSLTIQLIRHHQDKRTVLGDGQATQLLRQLQWADNQN